jgi:hypothetical protein
MGSHMICFQSISILWIHTILISLLYRSKVVQSIMKHEAYADVKARDPLETTQVTVRDNNPHKSKR